MSFTGCFASTPAGELLPPLIIYKSDATPEVDDDGEEKCPPLPPSLFIGLPRGHGTFGLEDDHGNPLDAFVWANPSAGVNAGVFKAYLKHVLLPLYPDAAD